MGIRKILAFLCMFPALGHFLSGQVPAPAVLKAAGAISIPGTNVAFDGTSGPLALVSPDWFPLVRDKDGNDIAAVGMPAGGKAIVFSHDAWFKADAWKNKGLMTTMNRSLSWLAGGKKRPRVLCFQARDMAAILRKRGWQVDSPVSFPGELKGYDLVVLSLPTSWSNAFDPAAAERLAKAMDAGLPVMAAGLAWVFEAYGDGKQGMPVETGFSGNRIFARRGLHFLPGYAGGGGRMVAARAGEHQVLAALAALRDLARKKTGSLDAVAYNRWRDQLAAVQDWHGLIKDYPALVKDLNARAVTLVPTEANPALPGDGPRRASILMADLLSRRHPEDFAPLLAVLGEFPGRSSAPANGTASPEQLETRFAPGPGSKTWQAVGLWMDAGSSLEVELRGLAQGEGIELRVGAHSDDLYSLAREDWRRWPQISETWELGPGSLRIVSRHGGAVYIELPPKQSGQGVELLFRGGVRMAIWRYGDDESALAARLAASPAPWLELEGQHVSFSVPHSALPPDFKPAKVMAYWDRAVSLVAELVGDVPDMRPQRFVADRQISMGYMHSGYPIMTHLDVASYQLGGISESAEWQGQNLFTTGAWGHFHELGHNWQENAWTFDGAGEVTVNLFTLYVMEQMLGIKAVEHPYLLRHASQVNGYLQRPRWETWKSEPFLALHTYGYLIDRFGWESLKKTITAYRSMNTKPASNQQKIDTWVLEWSRQCGHNLVPYFRQWAWPVSPAVAKELAGLPVWQLQL